MSGCVSRTEYVDRVVDQDELEALKNELSSQGYEEIEVTQLEQGDIPGPPQFRVTTDREVCLCRPKKR